MIKKALLILVLTSLLALGEGVVGNHEKDLVIKAFNEKTPAFIMKQFGRRLDFREKDRLGFPRWTYELDRKGGEELLTYKLNLLDKKWKVQNSKKVGGGWRRVFSFQAHFYRPIGNGGYICWDAFYHLLPTGLDYEKQAEKQAEKEGKRPRSGAATTDKTTPINRGSLPLPTPTIRWGVPMGNPRGSLNSKKADGKGVLGVKHNMNNVALMNIPAKNGDGEGRPSIPTSPLPLVPMPPAP